MKKLFCYLFLALGICSTAQAQTTISATFTFTNRTWGPSNSITIKANTRYFTNDTTSSPSTLITTNSANGSATNYFNHVSANPYGSGYFAVFGSSNKVTIIGDSALTASYTGSNWVTLSLSTNSTTPLTQMVYPITALSATNRTNQAVGIVNSLPYASNAIPAGIKAMENYATAATVTAVNDNAMKLYDVNNVDETVWFISDFNGFEFFHIDINYGFDGATNPNMISRIGATETNRNKTLIAPSIQFGTLKSNTIDRATITTPTISNPTFSGGISGADLVDPQIHVMSQNGDGTTNLYFKSIGGTNAGAVALPTMQVTQNSSGTGKRTWNWGLYNYAAGEYSADAETIMRLGDLPDDKTNCDLYAETTLRGDFSFPRTDVTSLANGNNIAVQFGTNYNIRLTATNAAVTLCGMIAPPRERAYRVKNELGGPLIITQNTSDPTPANRFQLYGGVDVSVPVGGECIVFYSKALSRWEVSDLYPLTATATNLAILDVGTTNATHISVIGTNNTAGVPQLKSLSPGYGVKMTNESGTNIAIAVDSAVVASEVNFNTLSNNFAATSNRWTTNFIPLQLHSFKAPATNTATLESAFDAWELQYHRTNAVGSNITVSGVHLSAAWQFIVPPDYATNSLGVRIASTLLATNGPNASNTIFQITLKRFPNGGTGDLRTNVFGEARYGTNTWSASFDGTNKVQTMTIPLGTNSLLMAGDLVVLKVARDTNDTYNGSVAVVGLQAEYGR